MGERDDFWVFGYGSLMWQPGFEHLEVRSALLRGYHRAFCVYSHHYRGTPGRPGLVLGLDRGGACRGLAFRVAQQNADAVMTYLDERELIGYAYLAKSVPIEAGDDKVTAYTYVADQQHRHYAGKLGIERSAELIMKAEGLNGLNRDYLINTLRKLETMGFADKSLHALLVRIERMTGILDQGSGI